MMQKSMKKVEKKVKKKNLQTRSEKLPLAMIAKPELKRTNRLSALTYDVFYLLYCIGYCLSNNYKYPSTYDVRD
jgi:hypothetical protein